MSKSKAEYQCLKRNINGAAPVSFGYFKSDPNKSMVTVVNNWTSAKVFPNEIIDHCLGHSSLLQYNSRTRQPHTTHVYRVTLQKWASSWENQQNELCAQRRLRSAWASAQSDQSSLSAWRKVGSLAIHWTQVKILIRLGGCGCPGWSESSLGAHAILLVLSWAGSNDKGDVQEEPRS